MVRKTQWAFVPRTSVAEAGRWMIHYWQALGNSLEDGRHRFRACQKAGVTPHFAKFDGSYLEAFEFVRAANIQRRDLSASQRAAIAVFKAGPEERKFFEAIKTQAEQRQAETRFGGGGNISTTGEGKSRDQNGKRYNVNGRYISDLEAVIALSEWRSSTSTFHNSSFYFHYKENSRALDATPETRPLSIASNSTVLVVLKPPSFTTET